jgi:hypothetical protein
MSTEMQTGSQDWWHEWVGRENPQAICGWLEALATRMKKEPETFVNPETANGWISGLVAIAMRFEREKLYGWPGMKVNVERLIDVASAGNWSVIDPATPSYIAVWLRERAAELMKRHQNDYDWPGDST